MNKRNDRDLALSVGPFHANICNDAMQKFRGVSFETRDQHKDISKARQTGYVSDTLDLITYLKDSDSLTQNTSLLNIANGMTAQDGVTIE